MSRLVAIAIAAISVAMTYPALAQGHGITFDGTYALAGLNAGYGFGRENASNDGLLLGAEASIVRLDKEWFWYGGYADALYAFGPREGRMSFGPELGFWAFGLDGGYLCVLEPSGAEHGFSVRPLLTVSLASLYGRYGQLLTGTKDRFGEVGILLKLPFWEKEQ